MAESSRFEPVISTRKDELLEGAVPKSTKMATEFWLTVFSDFLQTDSKSCDWKNVTERELAGLLEDFYCSAKKQDKSEYKRASMIAARGATPPELSRARNQPARSGFQQVQQTLGCCAKGEEADWFGGSCCPQG